MAYVDFERPPHAGGEPAAPARRRDRGKARAKAVLLTGGLILGIVALLFTLAFVALGEPVVAALVTILLLLPAASLVGGTARRR